MRDLICLDELVQRKMIADRDEVLLCLKNFNQPHKAVLLLSAIGAWVASFFLMGFIAMLLVGRPSSAGLMGVGVLLMGLAIGIYRNSEQLFARQMALSFSIGGHGYFLAGVYLANKSYLGMAGMALILCVVMHFLVEDAAHRYVSYLGTSLLLNVALLAEKYFLAMEVLAGLMSMVSAVLIVKQWHTLSFRPLILALLSSSMLSTLFWIKSMPVWPNRTLSQDTVVMSLWFACSWGVFLFWDRGIELWRRKSYAGTFILFAMLLVIADWPGLLLSFYVITVGVTRSHGIKWFGILCLLVYIHIVYYDMSSTLLVKSISMMGIGAVLLLMRWTLFKTGEVSRV